MLEKRSSNFIDSPQPLSRDIPSHHAQPNGFNKIVSIGYGKNKSHRLPICHYSLQINIIGLSTTGLTSGIGLAALGHKVIAVDHDQRKINALNQGSISFTDSKLNPLLKQVRRLNNLVGSTDLHHAILNTDITMVCIGDKDLEKKTPISLNIISVIEQISATLSSKREFHTIVMCQSMINTQLKQFIGTKIEKDTGKTLGKDFGLCFLPVTLKDNQALDDFYSLSDMTIMASDIRSETLIDKLLDGFKNKIKYSRYVKVA